MINPFIINLKSLSQNIKDCTVGAGEVNGRHIVVIFTQELAERFTEYTKPYLSWKHKNVKNLEGYNVFTKVEDPADEDVCGNPPTWEIHLPQAMLEPGDVVARIEIVDEQSIDASTNFLIKILDAPSNHDEFLESDTYDSFQKAVLDMNNLILDYEKMVAYQDLQIDTLNQQVIDLESNYMWHDVILDKLITAISDLMTGLAENEKDIISIQEQVDEMQANCEENCKNVNETAKEAKELAQEAIDEVNKIKKLFPVWEVLKR